MWERPASDATGDSRRTVLVSVEPALLGSVLARLLRARGWFVADRLLAGAPSPAAAIVSADTIIDLTQFDAPMTIVLPDDEGRHGQLLRTGEPQGDPFVSPDEMLGTILELVGAAEVA